MELTPKEKYSREQFLSDLKNPKLKHLANREVFKGFYDRLGEEEIQKTQEYKKWRMDFIRLGKPEPHNKIIELGCHAGFDLIHYARLGYWITGVDLSTSLIELATQKILKEPPGVQARIHLVNCFIEDLAEHYNGIYHSAILTETLEHVQDPLKILLKAHEVLIPGGKLFVSTPFARIGTYSHVRGINSKEMLNLLNQSEFKMLKIWTARKLTFAIAIK